MCSLSNAEKWVGFFHINHFQFNYPVFVTYFSMYVKTHIK